jgi:hypothetical protein
MYFHNSNYHVRPKHAVCLTSNNYQSLVVIDSPLMGYTFEQCAFLHESYVECGSPSVAECTRKLHQIFPSITVPTTTGIYNILNEFRSTVSLTNKKATRKADTDAS